MTLAFHLISHDKGADVSLLLAGARQTGCEMAGEHLLKKINFTLDSYQFHIASVNILPCNTLVIKTKKKYL